MILEGSLKSFGDASVASIVLRLKRFINDGPEEEKNFRSEEMYSTGWEHQLKWGNEGHPIYFLLKSVLKSQ